MDWYQAFSGQIIDRGLDYYERGLVSNLNIREDSIVASVYGSRVYDVRLKIKDGKIHHMKCNCPHAFDGNNCKHMVAVLYCADGEIPHDKDHLRKNDKSLAKLVKEADEMIVRDFLTKVLVNDEKLLNRFKSTLKCKITEEDMSRYKNQVNEIFNEHSGMHGFIDYYSAGQFAVELEEFLNNEISGMIENGQYEEAFELTNVIFIKLGNQDIDDSDGEIGDIAQECMEIWQAILTNSDKSLNEKIFRWFMDNIDNSVIDYMDEYLEEILFENFKEAHFLEEKLLFTEKQVRDSEKEEDSWSRGYSLGRWAIKHISLMEELNKPKSSIDEYCEKYLESSNVRKYYIERCINRRMYDKAIHLLEEGKQVDKDYRGLLNGYSLQLKNLYKQTENNQAYKKELWSLALDYAIGDLEVFNELKALYSEEEWKEQREVIFKAVSSYGGIADLYKSEKLYDRLLEVVLKSPNFYTLQTHEGTLKKHYPRELLNKYEEIVRDMATNTSNRKRYREIVRVLRSMQKYPHGKQKVEGIVSEWRSTYKNRRAMMDELNQL
ncbi:MAG TPA: hypothetical protein VK027_05315 [Chitinophagaceae bacterium]|nr:hypothetical protein [Chitinophagaceae bacterium]